MDRDRLVKYHSLYGFSILEDHFPDYIVFGQTIGYFSLATIVTLRNNIDVDKIKKLYEDVGYTCSHKQYSTEEDAHIDLYEHFFNIEASKKRAEAECDSYYHRQSEKLGSEYSYVDSPFTMDGVQEKHHLVQRLCDLVLSANEPVLCIIEAAAGYGKTCAAYEIYRKLSRIEKIAPIYIELSKNRSAKLFRYVLLDELDRKYSHIKADTVQNEIEAGFVPLIIDGFDELISKSIDKIDATPTMDDDFEHAETMLDTIVALLNNNARIILTSRKSSIFCGTKYEEWLQQHLNQFQVIRIALNEPDIIDWIGVEKANALKRRAIPVADICNPVILSYLKNTSLEFLDSDKVTSDTIIQRYFDMLLKREMDRQNLPMTVPEQYDLFTALAGEMVTFDITSEQKDFIAELIKEIYDLEIVRQRIAGDKPTIEELSYKLAGHVLLDRIIPSRDNIGFINEFIFGTLIGEYLTKRKTLPTTISPIFIDYAITAYSVRSEEKRHLLYLILKKYISTENFYSLIMDIKLLRSISCNYTQLQLSSQEFDRYFTFEPKYKFVECVFNQCYFSNVEIIIDCFEKCTFIDCIFSECIFSENNGKAIDNAFYGCTGHEDFLAACVFTPTEEQTEEINFEKRVLEQFWPIGRSYAQDRCTYRTLLAGFAPKDSSRVDDAISSLKQKRIIMRLGQYYYLEKKNKLTEIRNILGR